MKPSYTLLFLVSVLTILATLMLIFPKDGISLSKDLTLYFPDFQEWWADASSSNNARKSNAYIPDIVEEDAENYVSDSDSSINPIIDSLLVGVPTQDSSVYKFVPRPIQIDKIRQPLELPPSGIACLENLFKSLVDPDELFKVVHILHYGDSQIEADRISNYLRYKLQQQFGGSGPGLVPAKSPYGYKSPVEVLNEGKWQRYNVFPKIDTAVKHNRYGVLAAFTRFSPIVVTADVPVNDTLTAIDSMMVLPPIKTKEPETEEIFTGSINFVPATFGHANVKTIKRVKMFYGNNSKPFEVKVRDGQQILYRDSLPAVKDGYSTKIWNFANTPEDFNIDFSGSDGPDLYAFAMDGLNGVQVDNIPLRGCSGTIFTKINANSLAGMYRELNVKCIILQFGGNAVPSLSSNSVNGFKNALVAQIKYLKRIYPGVSIIFIGPADMSTKVQDEYQTYEVLPQLVEALKTAAFQNDCAFWDMYAAMGGWNTMPDWVFHDPPYGEKDFVHFTANGANVIARMFYSALIARYNEFIKK